jgi:hypothetical protein
MDPSASLLLFVCVCVARANSPFMVATETVSVTGRLSNTAGEYAL